MENTNFAYGEFQLESVSKGKNRKTKFWCRMILLIFSIILGCRLKHEFYWNYRKQVKKTLYNYPTSGRVVLRSKLVD